MVELYLIVFNNTHEAMTMEKKLKELSIANRIVPTPTGITHSCGLSIRFNEEDLGNIKSVIQKYELKIKNIYYKESGQYFSL
ncbi:DUF3343 domain-containing protein [Clostridium cellulovorans]|uniref:Putative Se/S carrier protein-like domain-containing protein n=1 Tax=Clostridium cellulovorans (strain ATCC 35296 / DSM 3052 / OCM 3 / 743B) TaxID=573061 RepID=D9SPC5_CLOC7|nr:DUF3343 domain-containing protein [Clostridium cellulovorans]ADL54027.1 Protein of unknown function DUF3343 [Clostridium cellulovorans 743B]